MACQLGSYTLWITAIPPVRVPTRTRTAWGPIETYATSWMAPAPSLFGGTVEGGGGCSRTAVVDWSNPGARTVVRAW